VLAGASAVTAPSPYLARTLANLRNDIRVIPNGLDIASYPYRERIAPLPRLVWLRALHGVYHPELAVEVLARLLPRFPDATLTMIGPDKGDGSASRIRAAVVRFGMERSVSIEGGVPKNSVSAHLSQGEIFLNTSRIDNAPVTLVEAMACGLPVVTTDAGGISDLVEHEHDALVAPVGEAAALAEQVQRVLEEPGLSGRLSKNGRESAVRHDWRVILPMWQGLFQEVVSDG
jgi:glycosyltransferase involved in cell wall biosynthesis